MGVPRVEDQHEVWNIIKGGAGCFVLALPPESICMPWRPQLLYSSSINIQLQMLVRNIQLQMLVRSCALCAT